MTYNSWGSTSESARRSRNVGWYGTHADEEPGQAKPMLAVLANGIDSKVLVNKATLRASEVFEVHQIANMVAYAELLHRHPTRKIVALVVINAESYFDIGDADTERRFVYRSVLGKIPLGVVTTSLEHLEQALCLHREELRAAVQHVTYHGNETVDALNAVTDKLFPNLVKKFLLTDPSGHSAQLTASLTKLLKK